MHFLCELRPSSPGVLSLSSSCARAHVRIDADQVSSDFYEAPKIAIGALLGGPPGVGLGCAAETEFGKPELGASQPVYFR
jgi:hypothetical protein